MSELEAVELELNKERGHRMRAESELKVLRMEKGNLDKMFLRFKHERESWHREKEALHREKEVWHREKERLLALLRKSDSDKQDAVRECEQVRASASKLFSELQEMTRLRLEAEAIASAARIDGGRRECDDKMHQLGLSPAKTGEEFLLGTALPATQKDPENPQQQQEQQQHLQQQQQQQKQEKVEDQQQGQQEEDDQQMQQEEDEEDLAADADAVAPANACAIPAPPHVQHLSDAVRLFVIAGAGEQEKENEQKEPAAKRQAMFNEVPSPVRHVAAAEAEPAAFARGPDAPIVALSGFGDQNSVVKLRLSRGVETLGGSVFLGKDMNDCITHVVFPANGGQKTVRALAAELMGKWCVSEEWIIQSLKAGKFISEEPFGRRRVADQRPFENTLFYLHSTFVQDPKHEDKVRLAKQLIVLAGGQLVDASHNVEPTYRLVSKEHGKTRPSDLFWADMMAMLSGPGAEEPVRKSTPSKKRQRKLNFDDDNVHQQQPLKE